MNIENVSSLFRKTNISSGKERERKKKGCRMDVKMNNLQVHGKIERVSALYFPTMAANNGRTSN